LSPFKLPPREGFFAPGNLDLILMSQLFFGVLGKIKAVVNLPKIVMQKAVSIGEKITHIRNLIKNAAEAIKIGSNVTIGSKIENNKINFYIKNPYYIEQKIQNQISPEKNRIHKERRKESCQKNTAVSFCSGKSRGIFQPQFDLKLFI